MLLPAMNPTLQGSRERIFSWLTKQRINRHSPVCGWGGGDMSSLKRCLGILSYKHNLKKTKGQKELGSRHPSSVACLDSLSF